VEMCSNDRVMRRVAKCSYPKGWGIRTGFGHGRAKTSRIQPTRKRRKLFPLPPCPGIVFNEAGWERARVRVSRAVCQKSKGFCDRVWNAITIRIKITIKRSTGNVRQIRNRTHGSWFRCGCAWRVEWSIVTCIGDGWRNNMRVRACCVWKELMFLAAARLNWKRRRRTARQADNTREEREGTCHARQTESD